MFMAMMQVVNNADVGNALLFQALNNFDLIFRFAKPRAMIIKPDAHTEFGGLKGNRFEAGRFTFDALRLFCGSRSWRAAPHNPQVALRHIVAFNDIEDLARLIVENGWKPPTN